MDWGMQSRLARIIKPQTGRAVMLAVDHGYFLGPISNLEEPRKTIEPLIEYADSLMLTRGVLRNCVDANADVPIVLRVSGGNSIVGSDLSNEDITVTFEDAIRLNAAAVALSIYVGTDNERRTIINLSKLVDEGEKYGIPVLAVTAVGKELEKRDARFLGLCCRIAAEHGARIVKTYYCDDFEKVTNSCPVPIVVAGGPKFETDMDVLNLTYDCINEGAIGVDMGRNIWQNQNPVGMIKAVRSIVHEGQKPDKAVQNIETVAAGSIN